MNTAHRRTCHLRTRVCFPSPAPAGEQLGIQPPVWQPLPSKPLSQWRFTTLLKPPWRDTCSFGSSSVSPLSVYLLSCKVSLSLVKGGTSFKVVIIGISVIKCAIIKIWRWVHCVPLVCIQRMRFVWIMWKNEGILPNWCFLSQLLMQFKQLHKIRIKSIFF